MAYKTLFSPMKIGGCEIKNRIAMAPMLMGFGTFDGTPTKAMLDYYEERAKGGAGIIFTEITRINDWHGASAFAQLAVSHDYHIKPLAEMAERIHKHGAKLFIQLHHPGRQNVALMINTIPLCIGMERIFGKRFGNFLYKLAPSAGKFMIEHDITFSTVAPSKTERSYFSNGKVRALRHAEIKKIIAQFAEGAERVKKAGCDGVMLHATHGYLIQQFLSPNTNKRTDEYGGSFENRMRFLMEIISSIREKCGAFPIVVRLTVDECYDRIGCPNKGYGLPEGVEMAKALEKAGVDAIDVSSASYDTFNYWLEPTSFECGWRKDMTKAVKDAVRIPVLGANLIRSPEQAEEQIKNGYQDFVTLGRPHIADPHWANKIKAGKSDEVKRCICCLYCIESMQNNAYIGGHGGCSVNPLVGAEGDFTDGIKQDGQGRKVVVVGGGPAGLTAAEWLLRRGFAVTLWEKEERTGGQILQAANPPGKEKTAWCVEDLLTTVKKLGGDVKTGVSADKAMIETLDPYAVFIASGSEPIKPTKIEGINRPSVYLSSDILLDKVSLEGKKVAVIGSGMTGLEVAEKLSLNNAVSIIEMAAKPALGTWMQHTDDILPKLNERGVKFYLGDKLESIGEASVQTKNVKTGALTEIAADFTVLALGVRKNNRLAQDFQGRPNVFVVGDAQKEGRIAAATQSAFAAAMSLK